MTTSEPKVDGRRARRERGRRAVVDATIDLFEEGHLPPAADDVAARAGVSTATLFRYYPTLDDLRAATIARFVERHNHLWDLPDVGVGPLPDRIERLVTARLKLHETVAPVARFARTRALELPTFAETLGLRRAVLAGQVAEHFAVELTRLDADARADRVDTIGVVTSFEAWDLATSMGRSSAEIDRAWSSAVERLLG